MLAPKNKPSDKKSNRSYLEIYIKPDGNLLLNNIDRQGAMVFKSLSKDKKGRNISYCG